MPAGIDWSDPARLGLGRYIGPVVPGDGPHETARCPAVGVVKNVPAETDCFHDLVESCAWALGKKQEADESVRRINQP